MQNTILRPVYFLHFFDISLRLRNRTYFQWGILAYFDCTVVRSNLHQRCILGQHTIYEREILRLKVLKPIVILYEKSNFVITIQTIFLTRVKIKALRSYTFHIICALYTFLSSTKENLFILM